MQITLINCKDKLQTLGIDVADNSAVSEQVNSIFPNNQGWSYNAANDVMFVFYPNPAFDTSSLGEVQNIDYNYW